MKLRFSTSVPVLSMTVTPSVGDFDVLMSFGGTVFILPVQFQRFAESVPRWTEALLATRIILRHFMLVLQPVLIHLQCWNVPKYIHSRYLDFTWIFPFYTALHFYSTTSQWQRLHFDTTMFIWHFFRWQFFIAFLSSKNSASPNVLILKVYHKLQDYVFLKSSTGWENCS